MNGYRIKSGLQYNAHSEQVKEDAFVIVRTADNLVYCGFLDEINEMNKTVSLVDARHIYRFFSKSLGGLASEGFTWVEGNGLSPMIDRISIFSVREILFCSNEARDSILNAPNSDIEVEYLPK